MLRCISYTAKKRRRIDGMDPQKENLSGTWLQALGQSDSRCNAAATVPRSPEPCELQPRDRAA